MCVCVHTFVCLSATRILTTTGWIFTLMNPLDRFHWQNSALIQGVLTGEINRSPAVTPLTQCSVCRLNNGSKQFCYTRVGQARRQKWSVIWQMCHNEGMLLSNIYQQRKIFFCTACHIELSSFLVPSVALLEVAGSWMGWREVQRLQRDFLKENKEGLHDYLLLYGFSYKQTICVLL